MRWNVFEFTDILIFISRKEGGVHIASIAESRSNVFGFLKCLTKPQEFDKNLWNFLFSKKIVGQSWRRS